MPDPDLPGAAAARRALDGGRAAVLPNPSPLTYVVAATTPYAVNTAKGRPAGQEVAAWVHAEAAWEGLAPALDLTPAAVGSATVLLRRHLVTLLVPLRAGAAAPDWIAPAVRDGHALLFGARWAPLAGLLADHPRLYVSSANRTGLPPAATAAAAAAMFGGHAPVLDGDALRDPGRPHAATTMLRIAADGRLELVRRGAQDAAHGPDPAAYLRRLGDPAAAGSPGTGRGRPRPGVPE
ncbi:hypothetical protein [Kitasatospora sp. MBT63]|uniref:hypothetical protein n=1 Tax=Kitasatospora sp. MBT63 TaxID=1444768 RepID=UPI0006920C65|nr:hypothetical protein [Kitasatospora sp. MBT63]